jgi:hypothetical protein
LAGDEGVPTAINIKEEQDDETEGLKKDGGDGTTTSAGDFKDEGVFLPLLRSTRDAQEDTTAPTVDTPEPAEGGRSDQSTSSLGEGSPSLPSIAKLEELTLSPPSEPVPSLSLQSLNLTEESASRPKDN